MVKSCGWLSKWHLFSWCSRVTCLCWRNRAGVSQAATSLQGVGLGFGPFPGSSAVPFVHVLLQLSSVCLEHAAVWWLVWGSCPDILKWCFSDEWTHNFLYHHSRFFGQLCSDLSVGRFRYVITSAKYILSPSFHTQCWFICLYGL